MVNLVRILFRKFQRIHFSLITSQHSKLESYLESFKAFSPRKPRKMQLKLESYLESFKVAFFPRLTG